MPRIDWNALLALEAIAASAADYLDACDCGDHDGRLDPHYYRACGELLTKILALDGAEVTFAELLARSPAAREIAESIALGQRLIAERSKD
jgi:hypothetical protein